MMWWRKIIVMLGYSIAGIIIFLAIAASSMHLLAPLVDKHHDDFEKFASQLLECPVRIGNINLSWNIYQPELVLEEVVLLDPVSQKPVLPIKFIKIDLDMWRSLLNRQPTLSLIKISGADVSIHQNQAGEVSLPGWEKFSFTDNATGQSLQPNKMFDWIFSQPKLILQNLHFEWIPEKGEKRSVTLAALKLTNAGRHHGLVGKATLHQELPLQAMIHFEWDGSIFDLPKASGKLYFYLQGLSLSQWLANKYWHELHITDGVGSAKIWAIWDKNAWQQIESTLQFYNVKAESALSSVPLVFSRVSGNVGWKRVGNAQVVAGDNILLDLPQHLWPDTSFSLTFLPTTEGGVLPQQLHIDYLDLDDTANLLKASGLLSKDDQKWLNKLNPEGDIHHLEAVIHGWQDWSSISFSTEFSGVSVNAGNDLPHFTNLDGKISWDGNQGDFSLNSRNVKVTAKKIFANPLMLEQLAGFLHWQKNAKNAWVFTAKHIQVANKDVNADTDLSLTFPATNEQASSPYIDLHSRFAVINVAHISDYLPLAIFQPDLVSWLRQAFLGGKVEEATAILQGRLNDFPFDHQTGKFLIQGFPKDIEFKFAPEWPLLQELDGKLVFSGRSMSVDVYDGKVLDIPLSATHAEIPYLGDDKPQILTVQGQVKSDLSQALDFIQQSPLQESIGKNLSGLQLQGQQQLSLTLTIPLSAPNNTTVSGDVMLADAILQLPEWKLSLNDLKGRLHFTESTLSAEQLTGELFSHPVILKLTTTQSAKKTRYLNAELQGEMNSQDLTNWLALPIDSIFQGSSSFQVALTLPSSDAPSQPIAVTVNSNLQGMAVKLPAQYAKKAADKTNFQLALWAQEHQPLKAKILYDKLFSIAAILEKNKKIFRLVNADLHLGLGEASWQTQPGILISGNFAELNWDKVHPYLLEWKEKKSSLPSSTLITPDMFRGIDLKIKKAYFSGMTFTDLRVQLTRKNNVYIVGLNNADISGEITLPVVGNSPQIQAKFQYLYLPASSAKSSFNIHPKTLPAILFNGNDVHYGEMKLGRVSLDVAPNPTGLTIKQFNLDSPSYTLRATGEWSETSSRLQGNLNATRVSRLLDDWGLSAASLIASSGDVNFNLNWPGMPFQSSLQKMSGDISIKLGKGRIINLSNSTNAKMDFGRLLNIFSLQNLPRHLSLDFSDVFEKGYSFDVMKGDFLLKNGNALTENTYFNGPLAHIGITGRIGLATKDLDIKLNITPYVTGSLPVVAALATVNPIAGVATWVVDKVVGHAVSKIITYNYSITGPWNNPAWTQVGTQKQTVVPAS